MFLTVVSVLSGVDWTAFVATHPPSLRLYRDLVNHHRAARPIHRNLREDLDLLCDAYPATLHGGPWGSPSPLRYRRMLAALRAAYPATLHGRMLAALQAANTAADRRGRAEQPPPADDPMVKRRATL